ncbi:nitrate reductase [Plectosphaerella plurivora]|uniref:Nitrate reductase [NADPH] n=1 Tax=Plectosphaerella plurivora TaxID=936078 RepID=A0A9P9A8Y8_9PEZI|nr:nitrate reductase [Plectosphaerella plurivora]
MGGTSHYVVRKRDHPGSSHQEIRDEPSWGAGHNHHVGFKNRDNRLPGYTEEARGRARALHEREARGELVNFRDVVKGQPDLHLIRPEDRSVGWRFALDCTEDWVKYGQKWPANKKAAQKKAESEKQTNGGDEGGTKRNGKTDDKQHGDLKLSEEKDLSLEERSMLRALRAESEYMSNLQCSPGTLSSPQKHNRTDISIDEADQFTPDNWFPRCPDLIRLTGKHPLNAEPPLTRLLDAGLVTPNELHYVRNHGPVPRLLWEFHTVDVDVGGKGASRTFGMDELRDSFPSVNIPVFLACDGNRRKELNMIRKSKGFNWGPGAGGCAYWKGALLRDVLIAAGLVEDEVEGTGGTGKATGRKGTRRRWVNFEGADDLAEGKYATCMPLAYAMDASNDVLIAYAMNDLPLPPDHGYPVRMIIPGHVGGRCVKWLSRIWVSDEENTGYYHIWDNRVLPSFVTDMESPFAETLFKHPSTACYEQNLNSVIVRPAQGETISLVEAARPGAEYRIQGFAYDGGGHEVQRVEISLDNGASWLYCVRQLPDMPIRHGSRFWTWCHWHIDVPSARLVAARSITVRCFNVFKNSQPREPAWNIMGMMNNSWYVVRSEVTRPEAEEARLLFRHPVEPGTGDGGWMKPSAENRIEAAKRDAGAPEKQFTREEVEKHDSEDDCWIVVGNKVYDATSVMAWHPGGKAPIMAHAGRMHQETTEEFESVHDDFAYDKLRECLLGTITGKAANFISENAKRKASEDAKSSSNNSNNITLQKHCWVPTKLIAREALSEDTRAYTFQLPAHRAVLGLATCQHVLLGFHMKDKMLVRSYTPTRPVLPPPKGIATKLPHKNGNGEKKHDDPRDGDGTFQLVVKTYFPTPEQPGGAMSNILDCMPLGEAVEIRGPTGEIEYLGSSRFVVEGVERTFKRVSLVVGGSGVTPGYALMARVILGEEDDGPEIRVVDANKTEGDILLRKEMEDLAGQAKGKLDVSHVLSHPPEGWEGEKGHVDGEMLKRHLFSPGEGSAVFVCGPPTMMQKAVMPALREWGFKEDEDLFGF